jgi:hypothetical protein
LLKKLRYFFLFLVFLGPLQAERVVQLIANFPVDTAFYTQALQRRGYEGKVIAVNIKDYEPLLLKKKGRWLDKLHLSFFNKISVAENVDKIVLFNLNPKVTRKYALSRLPKEKLVLFMWEPKTVLKHMYSSKIHRCFSKIFTWNDALVDRQTYFKFNYPVLLPMQQPLPNFEERKLCTLIASDLKSKVKNELYSQRKEAIRFFEDNGELGFEFYGRRWDPALYKSYRGAVDDKIGTLKKYRFCICYENTQGTPGYITEKIFDCFAAGTVPIYWGASNVADYIPANCFIDRRTFSTLEELHIFLKGMSKQVYEGYLENIQAFLTSDQAKQFSLLQLENAFCQAVYENL